MITSTNYQIQIVRKTTTGEDAYGNKINSETRIDKDVLLAWGTASTDYTIQRDISVKQATLFFPLDFEIFDTDEFIVENERFRQRAEVTGWKTPIGFRLTTGNIVEIERVEG